jgi:hypothetical protein
MSTDATEVRLALVARGYTPVPLHGKIPPLETWQRLENVTREQVEMWHRLAERAHPAAAEPRSRLANLRHVQLQDGLAARHHPL